MNGQIAGRRLWEAHERFVTRERIVFTRSQPTATGSASFEVALFQKPEASARENRPSGSPSLTRFEVARSVRAGSPVHLLLVA